MSFNPQHENKILAKISGFTVYGLAHEILVLIISDPINTSVGQKPTRTKAH